MISERYVVVRFLYGLANVGPQPVSRIDVYVALPPNTTNQRIFSTSTSPQPYEILTDEWNQKIAHYVLLNIAPQTIVTVSWSVEARVSGIEYGIDPENVGSLEEIPTSTMELYTTDGEMYNLGTHIVREAAKEAVDGETNPYLMAKRISDYVATHISYDMDDRWDDAATVLQRGNGSCSEYVFAFIALCREVGIPARYVGGTALPSSYAGKSIETATEDRVHHRWAEVYLPRYGWVPVDPTLGDFCSLPDTHLAIVTSGGKSELLDWSYFASYAACCEDEAFGIRVGHLAEWYPHMDAEEAVSSTERAHGAREEARAEGRTDGLEMADEKLLEALAALENGFFDRSNELADEAVELALAAKRPNAMSHFKVVALLAMISLFLGGSYLLFKRRGRPGIDQTRFGGPIEGHDISFYFA